MKSKFLLTTLKPKNFRFSLRTSLTAVFLSILMLVASNWQWNRYKEKLKLVADLRSNSISNSIALTKPEIELNSTKVVEQLKNKKIRLEGNFIFKDQFIVTNRKHKTGPGHLLFTLFKIKNSKEHLWISRGFIPFKDQTEKDWLKYDTETKTQSISGILQLSKRQKNKFSPKSQFENDGRKYLYEDLESASKNFKIKINTKVYLQLIKDQQIKDNYPAESISIQVPPSTHLGYTIEWILLAIATLIIAFVLQAFPRKNRRTENP